MEDSDPRASKRTDEEAEFKDDVLPSPWAPLASSTDSAVVVGSEQDYRERCPARLSLELLDDGAAAVGLLVEDDGLKVCYSIQESRDLLLKRLTMTMDHEHSGSCLGARLLGTRRQT